MAELINVPQDVWLTYLFKSHSPVIKDVGDQRDPWNIIVCSCASDIYPIPKAWRENFAYQKHFLGVLQAEFFSRLAPLPLPYTHREV